MLYVKASMCSLTLLIHWPMGLKRFTDDHSKEFNCFFWFFTRDHTNTHNQLAAANPEIKDSVADVISGYICDRKRAEQAEDTHNIHWAADCYWLVERKKQQEVEKKRKKKGSGATHHLLGAYWLCIRRRICTESHVESGGKNIGMLLSN